MQYAPLEGEPGVGRPISALFCLKNKYFPVVMAAGSLTQAARERLIGGQSFYVINNEYFDGPPRRFQFESELILKRPE